MGKRSVVRLANCAIYHSEDPMVELTAKSCAKLGEMVLENVNLEVSEGEFVYLIGRVGSGKSSLLKTLYGELPLVDGEGEVAGFNLRKLRRSQIPYLRRFPLQAPEWQIWQRRSRQSPRPPHCPERGLWDTGWSLR